MGTYDSIVVPVGGQNISASLYGVRVRDAIVDLDERTLDIESAISGGVQEVSSAVNSATFLNTTPAESAPIFGFTFVAPRSGRVNVNVFAALALVTAGQVFLGPRMKTGSTIGSGTVILDPAIEPNIKIGFSSSGAVQAGASQIVSGLVPGDTYNLTAVHWCSSGSATYKIRRLSVNPLPS